jgi:hypothetical protein
MTTSYLMYTEAHLVIIISLLLESVCLCPKVISVCSFQCTMQTWRYKRINVVKMGKTKLYRFYFSHKTLDLMENGSNHINSKWSNIYKFFGIKYKRPNCSCSFRTNFDGPFPIIFNKTIDWGFLNFLDSKCCFMSDFLKEFLSLLKIFEKLIYLFQKNQTKP